MTTTSGSPTSIGSAGELSGRSAWFYVTVGAVGSVVVSLVAGSHLILAIVIIPLMIAVAWSNPVAMMSLLPVWMVLLGFVRRFTPGGGNITFSGDPVILVGPIAILIMVFAAYQSGQLRLTPLARAVFAINVLALVEAFNPGQGSLLTGLGGLLFMLVPTATFWVAQRHMTTDLLWRITWIVALSSLGAAIYGLYQQFSQFPSWDQAWINSKGYTALNLGSGVVRAFGTFSSAQEYAAFLSVGLVAWVALAGKATRMVWPLHLACTITVAVTLFYESQRTSVFLTALALGVMAATRFKMKPVWIVLAGLAGVGALIGAAGFFGGSSGSGTGGVLISHQLSGITDPTGAGSSLPGHLHATWHGMSLGVTHPLGRGTGSVTLAAGRYTANSASHGTEFDPGNMGVAYGLLGEILYFILAALALRSVYRFAVRRSDYLGLVPIGFLLATSFQWFNGDLYAVCWLVWLMLGAADSLQGEATDVATAPAATVAAPYVWRKPGEARRSFRA